MTGVQTCALPICLEVESGKELWRNAYPVAYEPVSAARSHSKGPKSTATIADGKVYAFGITGVLSCLELADGKVNWRKDFSGEYRKTWPTYGTANSPLVEGKLCILGVGGSNDGGIVAFDRDTGKVVWRGGGEGPSYSSPVVALLAGRRQVVALTQTRLAGMALENGKTLWEIPFTTNHNMNAVTPVVHGDMVIFGGYKKPARAVRLVRDGAGVKAEQIWTNAELQMFMSSPVLKDGHLYGLTQRRGGRLMCVKLADGEMAWESSEGFGQYVSLILTGDRILVLDTRGILRVVAADPGGYKELARVKVSDGPTWAHLGLAGGRLYVKDKTTLTCYALAQE